MNHTADNYPDVLQFRVDCLKGRSRFYQLLRDLGLPLSHVLQDALQGVLVLLQQHTMEIPYVRMGQGHYTEIKSASSA